MSPFDEFEPGCDDSVIDVADFGTNRSGGSEFGAPDGKGSFAADTGSDRDSGLLDDDEGYPSFDDEEIDALFAALDNPDVGIEFGSLGRLLSDARSALFEAGDIAISPELAEFVTADEMGEASPVYDGDQLAREIACVDVEEMLRLFSDAADETVSSAPPSVTRMQRVLAGTSLALALVGGLVGAQHLRTGGSSDTVAGVLDFALVEDPSADGSDGSEGEDADASSDADFGADWEAAELDDLYDVDVADPRSKSGSSSAVAASSGTGRFASAGKRSSSETSAAGASQSSPSAANTASNFAASGSAATGRGAAEQTQAARGETTTSVTSGDTAPQTSGETTTSKASGGASSQTKTTPPKSGSTSQTSGNTATQPSGDTASQSSGPVSAASVDTAPPSMEQTAPPSMEETAPPPSEVAPALTAPPDSVAVPAGEPDRVDLIEKDPGLTAPAPVLDVPPALDSEPVNPPLTEVAPEPLEPSWEEPALNSPDGAPPTSAIIESPDVANSMGAPSASPSAAGEQVVTADPVVGETVVVAEPVSTAVPQAGTTGPLEPPLAAQPDTTGATGTAAAPELQTP